MNAIFKRRSVRKFLDKEIEQDKVEKLIRAGMQAPSAMNQRCWEFIVVSGRENLLKLAGFKERSAGLDTAPIAIIILGNEENMKVPTAWQQDLGAATQNVMLEAVELGLGTVWLGAAPIEDRISYIQNEYNLPKTLIPYCVLSVGYPFMDNANSFIDRYDESKVRYIK